MRKAKSKTIKTTKTVAARNGSSHISEGMRGWWRKRYIQELENISTEIRDLRARHAEIKMKIGR